jgi:Mrp family chromosome partitioning ATPase
VVAVSSGKAGVGQSVVTALLAAELARRGRRVGILDADAAESSIHTLLGLEGRPIAGRPMPVRSRLGIAVVSSGLPPVEEEAAASWRGALLARAIRRFWSDVRCWPLDDLLVDLPPGGSDEALTVAESLPLSGLVFVTTPHDSVVRARRSLLMARRLGVRVLGVVENMTHLDCPDTGRRHEPFGPGHGQDLAREAGAPLVARLPLDPVLTRFSDEGRIEEYVSDETRSMTQALIIELAVAATDAAGAAAMTPA